MPQILVDLLLVMPGGILSVTWFDLFKDETRREAGWAVTLGRRILVGPRVS
jgi:hypothetical protein